MVSSLSVLPLPMPNNVPVIEINQQNVNQIWPYLMVAIRKSQILALDLELSGLGNHPSSSKNCFPDRYANVKNAAETRTIFSLGIATFELRHISKKNKKLRYKCQVFNILTLEDMPFVMEPDSLCFLAAHGFDFNHLLKHAVRYSRKKSGVLHSLWEEILASGVSISLHNGLVDLAFIHHHLYMQLPESEEVFLANLSDWFNPHFRAQLWDSKYLAEYKTRFPASFLEYVFRKCQRMNYQQFCEKRTHLVVKFSRLEKFFEDSKQNLLLVEHINCEMKINLADNIEVCKNYQIFGYCKKQHISNGCFVSHDVDVVLDSEEIKATKLKLNRQKRQKKSALQGEKESNAVLASPTDIATPPMKNSHVVGSAHKDQIFSVKGSHRSGMDAFMTGFSVLFMQSNHIFNSSELDTSIANKLALPGKDFPLLIKKSAFAPPQSEKHLQNWVRISSRRPIIFSSQEQEHIDNPSV